MLTLDDFHVLQTPFAEEVNRFLPLPAKVNFLALTSDGLLQPLHEYLAGTRSMTKEEQDSSIKPYLMDDQLVIPFSLACGEQGAAVISEIDPGFLRKMSASWLREVREGFLERLEQVRLEFVDPETELYNRRAAAVFLQWPGPHPGFFLLLNTIFYRRTAAGNLQKLRETGDLILALTRCHCFSFGYGVFGLHFSKNTRKRALQTAHYLQRQLRREGMSKVQIGFARTSVPDARRTIDVLDRCWRALAIAEKRGPFGICDIDTVDEQHPQPFQLTDPQLLNAIRKRWRGLPRFTLALLSWRPMAETTNAFDAHIAQAVGSDGEYLAGSDTLASILIPDGSQETVTRCIDAVLTTCHERYGREAVSLGIASWPCLDFIKSDIPGNCLKALYHGSFLGPGSVVYFDHLSLNISGDYFFDEGDYQSALREYHRGLRQQPGDINLMNSLGVALVEHGQERRAAACFQDVLRQDAENYMALVNLGRVCQTLGKKEDAVRCFERAYRKHGQDDACGQELFLPLGRLYTEFGYPEKAIAIFEHWRTRPGSESEFLLFRLLGQSYMENQQPEEAIKACQRALRLFPHDSISMSTLGLLYVEQGEGSDVGLSLCNKALSLDNFNPDHWYRLSRALLCIGKRAEALEAGKQCLHLQRTHVEGTAQMGQVHKALGRDKLAKRYYMQALALKQCTQLHAKRIRRSLDELSRGCVQESDISSCGDRAKKAASQRGRRKK